MVQYYKPNFQQGATMIEVLVTMVILVLGLLGLAGLQIRLQTSEMESYQRAQALILLEDMASRMASNRNAASDYVTDGSVGYGTACPAVGATQQSRDISEWCQTLQGASEASGGASVGAMIGGLGCVEQLSADSYMLTVAWQGFVPTAAPPDSVSCGQGEYDSTGDTANCKDDRCRRVITTIVRVANLS